MNEGGVAVIGLLSGFLGGAGATWLGWFLTRKHERKRLWAEYAFKCTELHYELQQKLADAKETPVEALAAIKVWRTFFKALESFDETGQWPPDPAGLGLLNTVWISPRPELRKAR